MRALGATIVKQVPVKKAMNMGAVVKDPLLFSMAISRGGKRGRNIDHRVEQSPLSYGLLRLRVS